MNRKPPVTSFKLSIKGVMGQSLAKKVLIIIGIRK